MSNYTWTDFYELIAGIIKSPEILDSKIDAWAKGPGRRFLYYDPVLTFSEAGNDRFIEEDGTPRKELNPDSEALFNLGREAFARLRRSEPLGRDEFDGGYAFYWWCIDFWRNQLIELQSIGGLQFTNRQGDETSVDINLLDEGEVISLNWKYLTRVDNLSEVILTAFWQCYLFHALREIDNALIGLALDGREAVVAALGASSALSNAISIESGNTKEQEIRRGIAYRGAMEKLRRDPKQAAKIQVKECWVEWQNKPERYKTKSAFAKDMMDKYAELDSQAVITRWCSLWEKEAGD